MCRRRHSSRRHTGDIGARRFVPADPYRREHRLCRPVRACFLQVAISDLRESGWQATADRLEFRQELSASVCQRVPGQVILSVAHGSPVTAWKLMAAPDAGSEHF